MSRSEYERSSEMYRLGLARRRGNPQRRLGHVRTRDSKRTRDRDAKRQDQRYGDADPSAPKYGDVVADRHVILGDVQRRNPSQRPAGFRRRGGLRISHVTNGLLSYRPASGVARVDSNATDAGSTRGRFMVLTEAPRLVPRTLRAPSVRGQVGALGIGEAVEAEAERRQLQGHAGVDRRRHLVRPGVRGRPSRCMPSAWLAKLSPSLPPGWPRRRAWPTSRPSASR